MWPKLTHYIKDHLYPSISKTGSPISKESHRLRRDNGSVRFGRSALRNNFWSWEENFLVSLLVGTDNVNFNRTTSGPRWTWNIRWIMDSFIMEVACLHFRPREYHTTRAATVCFFCAILHTRENSMLCCCGFYRIHTKRIMLHSSSLCFKPKGRFVLRDDVYFHRWCSTITSPNNNNDNNNKETKSHILLDRIFTEENAVTVAKLTLNCPKANSMDSLMLRQLQET